MVSQGCWVHRLRNAVARLKTWPCHPCCQWALGAMWLPADAGHVRPKSLTWPLALALAGSAAAFPSTATPPLENWAPIFFSPWGDDMNKKENRKIKTSATFFYRFKIPARGWVRPCPKEVKKSDRVSFSLLVLVMRRSPFYECGPHGGSAQIKVCRR